MSLIKNNDLSLSIRKVKLLDKINDSEIEKLLATPLVIWYCSLGLFETSGIVYNNMLERENALIWLRRLKITDVYL